ncbi:MAG: hypothetical protein ACYDH6_13600 [Acidimicrobiales bacterium]
MGRGHAARILGVTGASVAVALIVVQGGTTASGAVRAGVLPTVPGRTTTAPPPTDTEPPTTVPPDTTPPPTDTSPPPPPPTQAPTTSPPGPASTDVPSTTAITASTTVASSGPSTTAPTTPVPAGTHNTNGSQTPPTQPTTTLGGPVPTIGSASPGGLFTPKPTELVLSPLAVLRRHTPGPSLVTALVLGIPGAAGLALALRRRRRAVE